jgi:hypothetical protein
LGATGRYELAAGSIARSDASSFAFMAFSKQLMELPTGKRGVQNNRFILADHERNHVGVAMIRKDKNELGHSTWIPKDRSVLSVNNQIGNLSEFDSSLFSKPTLLLRILGDFHDSMYYNQ